MPERYAYLPPTLAAHVPRWCVGTPDVRRDGNT